MSCGMVRRAGAGDVSAMAQLDALCFTVPWSEDAFRQELEGNELAFYLVAEKDGQIIGYAGLWAILDEGHITNVAVHPQHRKKGLGEMLCSLLIQLTEEAGLKRHTLEVRPSNEAALSLYEKLGFQVAGRRKGYYEDNGEDALILWRGASLASE